MTDNEIRKTKERLDEELRVALSTMDRKNDVFEIREKIKENQARCRHDPLINQYSGICPICGFRKGEN